jgi:AraC family transcriptional regulator
MQRPARGNRHLRGKDFKLRMNQAVISFDSSLNRGPSWGTEIKDPVWVTRATLDPRPDEQEHVLSRYQFDVHLGDPMPVEFHQSGKNLPRVVHFGDLTWTPAGDSCRATWAQIREVGFVTFSEAFMQQTADEMEAAHLPVPATIQYTDPLARELVLALVHGGSSDRLYTDTLANSLVVHLLKAANRASAQRSYAGKLSQNQLRRAIDYLEDHLGGALNLQSWAKEVGLSPYHFARLFRRTTGVAPHQFFLRQRIERAKSILSASDASLSSVAYDLGFASQSHFNRVFRQYTQMTPGEWRNAMSI